MFLGRMLAFASGKIDALELDGKIIKDNELALRKAKMFKAIYSIMIGVGTVFAYYIAVSLYSSFFGLIIIVAIVLILLAYIFEFMCKRVFRRFIND